MNKVKNTTLAPSTINLLGQETPLQKILSRLVLYLLFAMALIALISLGLAIYKFYLDTKLQASTTQVNQEITAINSQQDFINQFLLVQEKLALYQEVTQEEKIEDLFPKLSVLVPPGLVVYEMNILQDQVTLNCVVADQSILVQFVNNLNLASNYDFGDNQTLTIANTTAQEIAKSDSSSGGTDNYDFSLSFNYTLSESSREQ